jgi:hypothetical protein
MTARHMGTATVRGNVNPHMPLTADEVTIPEIFRKAGYLWDNERESYLTENFGGGRKWTCRSLRSGCRHR